MRAARARAPRLAAGRARALGAATRGTTNPNRLRRVDRWVNGTPWVTRALTSTDEPVVVDLGFGSSPITTVELGIAAIVSKGEVDPPDGLADDRAGSTA